MSIVENAAKVSLDCNNHLAVYRLAVMTTLKDAKAGIDMCPASRAIVQQKRQMYNLPYSCEQRRELWHLVNDGRADTFARARRLMRSFSGDEIERGLAHTIDLGWLLEVEEDTTAGGSKARRLTLGEVRP